MLRIVVISSLFLAACDVGEIPGATTDGGGGGDSGSNNVDVCVDTVTPVAAAHQHSAGGTNAGLPCQNSGCHGPSPTGPAFTFSGTVYTTSQATAPKPGATVKVTFGSTTVTAVTDDAGNFYSTQTIMFPSKTLATACPTIAPMVTGLQQGNGNCNTCHVAGGTTLPMYVQ